MSADSCMLKNEVLYGSLWSQRGGVQHFLAVCFVVVARQWLAENLLVCSLGLTSCLKF